MTLSLWMFLCVSEFISTSTVKKHSVCRCLLSSLHVFTCGCPLFPWDFTFLQHPVCIFFYLIPGKPEPEVGKSKHLPPPSLFNVRTLQVFKLFFQRGTYLIFCNFYQHTYEPWKYIMIRWLLSSSKIDVNGALDHTVVMETSVWQIKKKLPVFDLWTLGVPVYPRCFLSTSMEACSLRVKEKKRKMKIFLCWDCFWQILSHILKSEVEILS